VARAGAARGSGRQGLTPSTGRRAGTGPSGHPAAVSTALLAYRPPTPTGALPLVRRADVSAPVWTGMLLDGTLRPLWDGVAVLAGHVVTPALRLSALEDLVPHRGVVGRSAAVWVHGGGTRPDKVAVLVRPGSRRPDPHPVRRAAQGPLPDEDVLDLGTGRVTTVQRTGLDVARYTAHDDEAARLLSMLLPLGFDPEAAAAALGRLPGERGVQRARERLATLRRG
jgi:hypothetical protein